MDKTTFPGLNHLDNMTALQSKLNNNGIFDLKSSASFLSHIGYYMENGVRSCSKFYDLVLRDCENIKNLKSLVKKLNYNLIKESSDLIKKTKDSFDLTYKGRRYVNSNPTNNFKDVNASYVKSYNKSNFYNKNYKYWNYEDV
jgi:hypothetical protein